VESAPNGPVNEPFVHPRRICRDFRVFARVRLLPDVRSSHRRRDSPGRTPDRLAIRASGRRRVRLSGSHRGWARGFAVQTRGFAVTDLPQTAKPDSTERRAKSRRGEIERKGMSATREWQYRCNVWYSVLRLCGTSPVRSAAQGTD